MIILLTFATVSVSGILEGSSSNRHIFFCVVTSLLGKGLLPGEVGLILVSGLLSVEAEL